MSATSINRYMAALVAELRHQNRLVAGYHPEDQRVARKIVRASIDRLRQFVRAHHDVTEAYRTPTPEGEPE